MLDQLEAIIRDRQLNPVADSYTNRLFARGRNHIAQKVGEEAVEVLVAALGQGKKRTNRRIGRSVLSYACSHGGA